MANKKKVWKPDPLTLVFADNLRRQRARKGYTLADLSAATKVGKTPGLSGPHLSLLERARRAPSLETLDRLAQALQVNVCTLLTLREREEAS